jgi:SpoVK/Ycf46/Vps4 family AAA+-type ATPase
MPHTEGNTTRLCSLWLAGHPCVRIVTSEEAEAIGAVREAAARRYQAFFCWSLTDGLQTGDVAGEPPLEGTTNPAAALVCLRRELREGTACLLDMAPHLSDAHAARALRDLLSTVAVSGGRLVLIDHAPDAPAWLAQHSTPFELALPNEDEVDHILRAELRRANRERAISVEIGRRDWGQVVRALQGLPARQVRQIAREAVAADQRFDETDLATIIAAKRRALGSIGSLEHVEAPASLDDVGGLDRLKKWLADRGESFGAEAAGFGLVPPRGVLLLGVQGAGKSLCAKAIAAAWGRTLLRLDPSTLYDRYVGASEQRLRDALRQAEAMAPVVLWIDEIEKGFASAAAHSTDGGLSQRMFGTLLTWMNDHTAAVFMVATANNIDALPPELLRKGRFDEIFFVDLPGAAARLKIVQVHLKRRGRDPGAFDLDAIVQASEGYSGAEIEQGVVAALHTAFAAGREVTSQDLVTALRESPPLSVTRREQIAALRKWAQGRCVPAD